LIDLGTGSAPRCEAVSIYVICYNTAVVKTVLPFVLLSLVFGSLVFFYIKQHSNLRIAPTQTGLQVTNDRRAAQLAEDWVSFTNIYFHFTFTHPKSMKVLTSGIPPGGDVSDEISNPMVGSIFSVERIYVTDLEIQKEIDGDTKVGRVYSDPQWTNYIADRDRTFAQIRKYRDLSLEDFAQLVRQQQILAASSSPDKQDTPLQKVTVDGLPAYQYTQIAGMPPALEAESLGMFGNENWGALGTHRFILLEDAHGEKYYIRYKPEDPVSEQIFESFHFVK
jgi:hypothetical protein